MVMERLMKPYEEVCFPSGILRWIREGDEYVCRLTEDQINEIKEIHEEPWVKTYSGGKPNYTQPDEAMMKRVMDGIPDMPIKVKSPPILPGGGIGRHPDIQARKEGDLIVADLPQVPRGSGGIRPEPTVDGWPLYSGLPAIKVQDKSFEEFAQSFAQSAQVIGIPQREWHELTDNEIATIKSKYGFGVNIFSFTSAVRELETWLKERNT